MGQGYSMLGFVVIVVLYAAVGVMAARGTICIFRKMFAPKSEQIFYAMFLTIVAALYLAFAAYFWSGNGVAIGNLRSGGICRNSFAGCAAAVRPHRGIFHARTVGPAARTSGAWRPLRVRAEPTDRDPTRLRILLCSLRLLHGGVFLRATRRVECRVEGGATVNVRTILALRPRMRCLSGCTKFDCVELRSHNSYLDSLVATLGTANQSQCFLLKYQSTPTIDRSMSALAYQMPCGLLLQGRCRFMPKNPVMTTSGTASVP
jgi:hypothetical protein